MATKVPADGIRAYMDAQVSQLTPPNLIWRIRYWFSNGPGVLLVVAAIVLALAGSGFSGTKSFVHAVVALAAIPIAVAVVVLAIGARDPGYWRRYSISQLLAKHPKLYDEISWAPLAIRLHGLPSEEPEVTAEFEAAVLEWRDKTYGLVLFQVLDHSAEPIEKVIQVSDAKGSPLQFGEAYALPAT